MPTKKVDPTSVPHDITDIHVAGPVTIPSYKNSKGIHLPYLQKDREKTEAKCESFLLCNNCHRYISVLNNTPCTVKCSHTFCEVCLITENSIRCEVCKINHPHRSEYIENISYRDLLGKFVEKGQKCFLDSVYQEYHHRINKRLKEIATYLPIWKEQSHKGERFQMTLGFWVEEIQLEKNFAKGETCSPMVVEKLECVGDLMSKADSLLEYQTREWDKTIQEHTRGTKILNILYPTYLTLNFVLNKMDIYVRSSLEHRMYYFKVSCGMVTSMMHVHAGCRRSKLSKNFEQENVIMDCKANLYDNTEAFIDVAFQINEKRKMTRLYVTLDPSSNKSEDFRRKVISLMLGQWQSLKGIKIDSKNGNIVIPDPNPYKSVFDIPTSYNDKVLTDESHTRGDVIGRKTPFTELMILLNRNETLIRGDHYLVGKVKSGLLSLEDSLGKAEGLIEDCGLVLSNKGL